MLSTDEIKRFIDTDRVSVAKVHARKALDYYEGKHDIRSYTILYTNAENEVVEDKTRSNIKISHPFFTELVDQEVQYLLSSEKLFVAEDDTLQGMLDGYFDDEFKSELGECLTDVCSLGWGYMYAYADEQGRIAFTAAESLNVIEVRAKDTDDNAEYVIYLYQDTVLDKHINRIEVWDKAQTWYYVQDESGKIAKDKDATLNPRPHVVWQDTLGSEYYGMGLGYIPFFRIDNDRKRRSNLWAVKDLIDDYDLMACALSNNLQDFDSPVWAVQGFQGDNVSQLIQNVKERRMVGVPEGGGIDVKTVNIPYEARQLKLSVDKEAIYHFGFGLDPTQVGDGNITNVVIKSRYALLDMKCNKLEKRLRRFLRGLIKVVIDEINATLGMAYTAEDVEISLEREVITNALDNANIAKVKADTIQAQVTTALNVQSVVGQEETVRMIADLLDIDPAPILEQLAAATPEPVSNPRQMYPVMSVLQKYQRGTLTRNNAIRMLKMRDIPEADAIAMLDDKDEANEPMGDRGMVITSG